MHFLYVDDDDKLNLPERYSLSWLGVEGRCAVMGVILEESTF